MSVIWTMRNIYSIGDASNGGVVCRFQLRRASRVDAALNLDIETPCHLCLLPVGRCNLVDVERVFRLTIADMDQWNSNIVDPEQSAVFNGLPHEPQDLTYDAAVTPGCHWTGSYTDSGDGLTITVDLDLAVSVNSGDPTKVDFSLAVTLTMSGAFNDSLTVTYTQDALDPESNGPFTLNGPVNPNNRTFDQGGSYEVEFPPNYTLEGLPWP